jgi:hypothetical protein
MTKKILIAGFACLSLMVIAQSSGTKDQAASAAQTKDAHPKDVATGQVSGKTVAPRDLATGQASGKRQYQPVIIRKVSDDDAMAAREQQSPKATGKTSATDDWQNGKKTAQDDWHAPAVAKTSGSSGNRTSPADVNQDGSADRESPTMSKPKPQARVAAADVNGDGKADVARVAKGDVTGDGKADAAINNSHSNIKNSRDAASGQASGKRVHQDITVTKEAGAAPKQ